MIAVSEINDIERLNRFSLLWKDLYGRTPRASFFQTLDWLECYWNHYGEEQKLRTLIVSVAAKPIGIVPLIVKTVKTPVGNLRVLTYPMDGWGTFYGPIGPYPAATLSGAMRYLQESRRDWDAIDLRPIDTETFDRDRTPNAMRGRGFQSYKQEYRDNSIVEIQGDWLDYWIDRSDQLRRRYQSAEKSLSGLGTVRYVRYRPDGISYDDSDPRWELYSAFEELYKKSSNSESTLTETRFLREAYVKAVWAGAADLNLLYIDDQPVAGAYNYHRNGQVENIRTIAVNELQSDAVTALTGRMLQNSFHREDGSFLFAPDNLQFTSGWETSPVKSYRYTHFARVVPQAQMLRLRHCLSTWFGDNSDTSTSVSPPQRRMHGKHPYRRPYIFAN